MSLQSRDIPDLLAHLIDRSLVSYDEKTHRYRMIESVRDYARELSDESGEATKEMHRFLQHMLDFVAKSKPRLSGQTPLQTHKEIAAELDNIRAAMDWALNTPGLESLGLRIASDLGGYWSGAGLIQEGQRWLSKTVESSRDPDLNDLAWAKLHQIRLAYMSGDLTQGDEVMDGVIQNMEANQDMRGLCLALTTKAWKYAAGSDDIEEGRVLMQRTVSVAEEAGHPEWGVGGMVGLGEFARLEGDLRLAEKFNVDALAAMKIFDVSQLAIPLVNLGAILLELGELDRSFDYYKQGITAALPYNNTYVLWAVQGVGMVLLKQGDFENGGRLFGYATHALAEEDRVDEEADDRVIKRVLAEATAAGGEAFLTAMSAGHALTRRQALALAE